jgi:putative ABC transport system permease protein
MTLLQDIRYAVRRLLKSPGFAVVAVGALALGIGANTAIFSVVNSVLLRPLPYPAPEQLVQLWEARPRQNMPRVEIAPHEFLAWADQSQSFQRLAAIDVAEYNLTGRGEPERVSGSLVSAAYFPLLGVTPARGRTFLEEEDRPGANNVVVLGHELWQSRFNSDPSIVGQTLSLDGVACTVVGVLPRGFRLPNGAELARPIAFDADDRKPGSHYLNVLGRLKEGVAVAQAEAEMATVAARVEQSLGGTNVGHQVLVVPLHEEVVGGSRTALLVLLGAVALVLLIACANVANLLLARAAARRREVAVRAALGASRWRIVRQLLAESLLLSALGGVLGLLLAVWGVELLVRLDPTGVQRAGEVTLDWRVLAFTLGLSVLTGLLFGLAPALQASKADFVESLKEGGRSGQGLARSRLRSALVVAEVALTLVLLVGAGLLLKSFSRLLAVDPGLDPRGVLTLDVALPPAKYAEPQRVMAFYERLLQEAAALPGVQAAGAVSVLPLAGDDTSNFVLIEGRAPLPPGQALRAGRRNVTTDYFRALGISLKQGRGLTASDASGAQPVLVINEAMARSFFPGEEPIGKRIRTGGDKSPWVEIVGVVGDVRHRGLDVDTRPEMFFPHTQTPSRHMTLVVRAADAPAALAAPLRERVRSIDQDQPVGNVKTMEEWVSESVASRRFTAALLGVFAAAAAGLAALGLYGVVSYSVAQRTHEIGLRVALGARPRDVLRLVIGQGMVLTLVGTVVGVAAALALTRVISGLLFNVGATDPTIFVAVPLLLTSVALLACYFPARRATKVDPMVALRYE